jgi:hypothetical protein
MGSMLASFFSLLSRIIDGGSKRAKYYLNIPMMMMWLLIGIAIAIVNGRCRKMISEAHPSARMKGTDVGALRNNRHIIDGCK